jgi:hypothetical protein
LGSLFSKHRKKAIACGKGFFLASLKQLLGYFAIRIRNAAKG